MGENGSDRDARMVAHPDAPNQQPSEVVDVAPSHSKRSPAFQFYPADFISSGKVDRMSMTERGIYITLLARCWLDDGLPTDMASLAAFARMKPAQFERVWFGGELAKCFVVRSGKLRNLRLDDEHRKQVEYRQRQRDNGKRGGRPKGLGISGLSENKGSVNSGLSDIEASTKPKKSSSSSSSFSSSSSSSVERTRPLIQRRRMDAAFEHECGIYMPQRAHDDFLALHPGEDLAAWFFAVCDAWAGRNTGADMFRFWKARHDERWPPEQPKSVDKRLPEWAR